MKPQNGSKVTGQGKSKKEREIEGERETGVVFGGMAHALVI